MMTETSILPVARFRSWLSNEASLRSYDYDKALVFGGVSRGVPSTRGRGNHGVAERVGGKTAGRISAHGAGVGIGGGEFVSGRFFSGDGFSSSREGVR